MQKFLSQQITSTKSQKGKPGVKTAQSTVNQSQNKVKGNPSYSAQFVSSSKNVYTKGLPSDDMMYQGITSDRVKKGRKTDSTIGERQDSRGRSANNSVGRSRAANGSTQKYQSNVSRGSTKVNNTNNTQALSSISVNPVDLLQM